MTKNKTNPGVDFYFSKEGRWQAEINKLRTIILQCGLQEELKWGCPCYRYNDANTVLIHVFKAYCAVLFFKGALLDDANGILIQQTKNVQLPRQIRFTQVKEVTALQSTLKAYIYEAIEVEKAGLKLEPAAKTALLFPEEFQKKLDETPALKAAFDKVTPGRQRAYNLYFSAPKLSKTRQSRVDRYTVQILRGKGLND